MPTRSVIQWKSFHTLDESLVIPPCLTTGWCRGRSLIRWVKLDGLCYVKRAFSQNDSVVKRTETTSLLHFVQIWWIRKVDKPYFKVKVLKSRAETHPHPHPPMLTHAHLFEIAVSFSILYVRFRSAAVWLFVRWIGAWRHWSGPR